MSIVTYLRAECYIGTFLGMEGANLNNFALREFRDFIGPPLRTSDQGAPEFAPIFFLGIAGLFRNQGLILTVLTFPSVSS